jgi:hypothetical protein
MERAKHDPGAGSLGLNSNKVVQHVTCQNHTHECENQK